MINARAFRRGAKLDSNRWTPSPLVILMTKLLRFIKEPTKWNVSDLRYYVTTLLQYVSPWALVRSSSSASGFRTFSVIQILMQTTSRF